VTTVNGMLNCLSGRKINKQEVNAKNICKEMTSGNNTYLTLKKDKVTNGNCSSTYRRPAPNFGA